MNDRTVVIKTTEETMNGMVRLCTSLLNGPLRDPKLSVARDHKRRVEDFLRDYQQSLFDAALINMVVR